MPAGQQAVPKVRSGEDNRSADRKQPVGDDTETAMRHGRAKDKQAQSRKCSDDDARVAVPRIADADGNDAQRNGEIKHLRVQVAFGERRHKPESPIAAPSSQSVDFAGV